MLGPLSDFYTSDVGVELNWTSAFDHFPVRKYLHNLVTTLGLRNKDTCNRKFADCSCNLFIRDPRVQFISEKLA